MLEEMMSKGKGVVIEEIVKDHDVKDAVGKGFASESENSGKLLLLKWYDSNKVGNDGNVVEIETEASTSKVAPLFEGINDNDVGLSDFDNNFPPSWFDEIMNEKRQKG
ncbi:hypothetical protein Tco_1240272 [Tanacetum coccineum]